MPSARRSGLSRRCLGGLPRPDIVLLNTTIFLYDLQLFVGSCAARRCGGGTLGRSGGGGGGRSGGGVGQGEGGAVRGAGLELSR